MWFKKCVQKLNKEPINTHEFTHFVHSGTKEPSKYYIFFPFTWVRRGLINQLSGWLDCVLTWVLCGPSDILMDELETCCHINTSPRGDGWESGIWRAGQQPRFAAQRPKGEHEMPISYDNADAHAFWHRVHLAMFTDLSVALKDVITLLSPPPQFSLSSSPPSLHVDLSTCCALVLFVFIQVNFSPLDFFYTAHLFTFPKDLCASPASLPVYYFC